MLSVGFEPTIPAGERPQTYALHRAVTGTGCCCDTTHLEEQWHLAVWITVRAVCLNARMCTAGLRTKHTVFPTHTTFMFLVWLLQKQTISLHRIRRIVFLVAASCFLWGTTWIFLYIRRRRRIWYDMIWYNIYLAAIGLTPGGSGTAHIYTQTVHRIQRTEHT